MPFTARLYDTHGTLHWTPCPRGSTLLRIEADRATLKSQQIRITP